MSKLVFLVALLVPSFYGIVSSTAHQAQAVVQAIPVEPWNHAITPLIAGHPDQHVVPLVIQLLQEVPQYFALGGNAGRMYVIQDPEVPPFILSDVVGKANHYEAPALCPAGSTLPNRAQLEALRRAMSPNGKYDQYFISGISGTYVWSSGVLPDLPDLAFGFSGSIGYVVSAFRDYSHSVRCIRTIAEW